MINAALELYFPSVESVNIIAEPGRYYVASAVTLASRVHTKRDVYRDDKLVNSMYFLLDGIYGMFNPCDPKKFLPITLKPSTEGKVEYDKLIKLERLIKLNFSYRGVPELIVGSNMWLSWRRKCLCFVWIFLWLNFYQNFFCFQISKNVNLPRLDVGDYVIFPNMGAYTLAICSRFNGIPAPRVEYYIENKHW